MSFWHFPSPTRLIDSSSSVLFVPVCTTPLLNQFTSLMPISLHMFPPLHFQNVSENTEDHGSIVFSKMFWYKTSQSLWHLSGTSTWWCWCPGPLSSVTPGCKLTVLQNIANNSSLWVPHVIHLKVKHFTGIWVHTLTLPSYIIPTIYIDIHVSYKYVGHKLFYTYSMSYKSNITIQEHMITFNTHYLVVSTLLKILQYSNWIISPNIWGKRFCKKIFEQTT